MSFSRSSALRFLSAAALIAGAASPACGPGAGQSNGASTGHPLYEKSFAGANKCNPKNADRPFIIDWDATDQSSFQAHTNSDIVFVEYKGCELRVLDGCRNDSVKGSFGSYKPVEFTSGGVETLDVHDEGELYAKLPLGAASLGGRVSSGEKFHMEYYVSGTRTATRDAVYRSDLKDNAACAGATHFVYAYNLGAFALASSSSLKSEVNGSYFGFGAGGSKASENKADKKGGELASCKGDSAKETETCKVPVRLTLREITAADNPVVAESKAPETDASLALASKLKASTDAEKQAAERFDTATTKMNAKDGKGCLKELDEHDKLDPRPMGLSTNPAAGWSAYVRAQCLMAAGQCDAGKALYRKAYLTKSGATGSAEQADKITDATAGMWCQGGKMSPRDQLIAARMEVEAGAWTAKKDAKVCMADFDLVMKLHKTVKPQDDDDDQVKLAVNSMLSAAPNCLAKAGDCAGALKAYRDASKVVDDESNKSGWYKNEGSVKSNFESIIPKWQGH
ncbi:MAG: hypothetical protein NVS3B10_21320 [Polyangiales bacterium]